MLARPRGGDVAVPKSLIVTAAAGVFLLGGARPLAADCSDPFRNPDDVLAFTLRTTTAIWAAFQASEESGRACDDQYPYFSAEFRCGDSEPFLSIGFRRKRDRSETKQKLPIKLDFNRNVPEQRWPAARGSLGFRKLTLNSGQADDAGRVAGAGRPANPGTLSAILTEHLAWRVMRQELPEASGVAYARLTVQFTDTKTTLDQGLYVLIEDIDRTAVRARFGADEGVLLKTTDLGCVDQVEYDDGAPNPASELFQAWLAESPAAFPAGWYARTEQALHLDPLLRQEALRELLANTGDTVLGNRNNYYAVDLRDDRRWYLPWDLDDMFRPFPQVRAPETALVRNCTGGAGCALNQVGLNIRDQAEIRARYLEIMCQLSNGVARESKLVAELTALDALIRPLIAQEVASIWAPFGKDPLDPAGEGTYAAEVERMKIWIPARIQAVRKLIEAEGVACPAGCAEGATTTCEFLGLPSQRSCTAGRWAPCVDPRPATATGGAGGAAGSGGTAGRGGAGGGETAGTGGTSGGSGGAEEAGMDPAPGNGCGCVVPDRRRDFRGPQGAGAVVLLAVSLMAAVVRRRRR